MSFDGVFFVYNVYINQSLITTVSTKNTELKPDCCRVRDASEKRYK